MMTIDIWERFRWSSPFFWYSGSGRGDARFQDNAFAVVGYCRGQECFMNMGVYVEICCSWSIPQNTEVGKSISGSPVPKVKTLRLEHIGTVCISQVCFLFSLTGFQILDELNPPTKVMAKFLKTWRDQEKNWFEYTKMGPSFSISDSKHPADVALPVTLSRRLILVVKIKNILNIEAGLEMIALAMAISSEVQNYEML